MMHPRFREPRHEPTMAQQDTGRTGNCRSWCGNLLSDIEAPGAAGGAIAATERGAGAARVDACGAGQSRPATREVNAVLGVERRGRLACAHDGGAAAFE